MSRNSSRFQIQAWGRRKWNMFNSALLTVHSYPLLNISTKNIQRLSLSWNFSPLLELHRTHQNCTGLHECRGFIDLVMKISVFRSMTSYWLAISCWEFAVTFFLRIPWIMEAASFSETSVAISQQSVTFQKNWSATNISFYNVSLFRNSNPIAN